MYGKTVAKQLHIRRNTMDNIQHYIGLFFEIFGAAVALASLIVKITPSQKDDAFLSKVVKVFDQLSIFNPNGKKIVDDE